MTHPSTQGGANTWMYVSLIFYLLAMLINHVVVNPVSFLLCGFQSYFVYIRRRLHRQTDGQDEEKQVPRGWLARSRDIDKEGGKQTSKQAPDVHM